tara:strand:- start:252 stop:710 length:459 start_codon:yes stop_codon:yes gene_type:complete
MLERLLMNSFTFLRKSIFILLMINFVNTSVLGEQSTCLNYPYPDGIYFKNKFSNKKQLIYTHSGSIQSTNIKKIEFFKKKNNLYAITSLNKYIKIHFPNLEEGDIGIYNLYSCFDSDGTYKISYAQRNVNLKNMNIFQKLKNYMDKKFFNDL